MSKPKAKKDKSVRERVVLNPREGGSKTIPAPSPLTETKVKETENETDKT